LGVGRWYDAEDVIGLGDEGDVGGEELDVACFGAGVGVGAMWGKISLSS